MSEDTQTMIQHALDQDWNKANKIFGDMMSAKVQDVLDQEKIRLADQIYNGAEEEIEDEIEEIDDEQLELELDDETDDQEGHEEPTSLEDADQGVQEPVIMLKSKWMTKTENGKTIRYLKNLDVKE